MGKDENLGITIAALSFITILLLVLTMMAACQPKKIEKYMDRVYELREKFSTREGFTDFKMHKKMKMKMKGAYKALSKRIQHNLILILKKNKHRDGGKLVDDNNTWEEGLARLKVSTVQESSHKEGTYTINKGPIYLCDVEHPDDNTLAHVLIHEYAHVINATIGHDELWSTLFDRLQDCAHDEGWFDRHRRVKLETYCGGKYNN